MGIGAMRHRITFQAENPVSDGAGGQGDPWASPSVVATVWANIKPKSGNERFHGEQIEAAVTHMITIRHRTDITAKHRILFGARLFNIRSIRDRDDERTRYQVIMAVEGVVT